MAKYFYPDDGKRTKEGYCSWCFQHCEHELLEKGGIINRSKYQCSNCTRETIQCRRPHCSEFARIVPSFREERCYVDRGFLKSWNDKEGIAALHPVEYCSNCFEKVTQKVIIINPITGGRTYECTGCQSATCRCKECDEAFALNDVEKCAKCQRLIEEWADVEKNKESIFTTKVCSWCLEWSKHICRNLEDKEYQCITCTGTTKPCKKCDYMKAKKECAKCAVIEKGGTEAWDELMTQKKANDEKYEDWAKLMKGLERPSPYFNKARKAGMIRPFIVLILMHPRIRVYVGMTLGLVLSKLDDYLDSHAEAWYLLSHSSRGLIARSTTRNEKLNHFGRSADWYLSLHRLMTMYLPQSHWVEIPKDTLIPSVDVDNEDMIQLELILIQDVIDRQTKSLTDVARTNLEAIREHNEQYKIFKQLVKEGAHYQPGKEAFTDMQLLQAFQQFGLHLKEEELTKTEATTSNIMAKYAGLDLKTCGEGTRDSEFSKTSYFITGKVASKIPMIAMKQALAAVVPILGWAVLANNLSGAILRETVDVCAMPVREILLHYTLLTARGVEIEEFYNLHDDIKTEK